MSAPSLDDLLETVRSFVSSALPGEQAVEVRIALLSGRRVQHPVPALPARKPPPPPRRHSPDFRSCSWDGNDFAFTATQASVVRLLWEAMEDATPDVSGETLLEESRSDGTRVRDLFRGHPAWGSLIVPGVTRGTFRLSS